MVDLDAVGAVLYGDERDAVVGELRAARKVIDALGIVRAGETAYQEAREQGDFATCQALLDASLPERLALDAALAALKAEG